jgi:hypothetical protein
MIAKKVSKKSSSKAKGISDLITYIFAKPDSSEERLLYSGSRNFITEDLNSQRCEMIGLALSEMRSPQPVCHWILSWKEYESPSVEQVEESVDIFLKELGLENNQTLFAIHGDTENKHVHLIINRVQPELGKVITPNKGFDKIAGLKAIARIEKLQEWEPEKGALFRLNEKGEIERNNFIKDDKKRSQQEPNSEANYSDPEGVLFSAKDIAFNIFLKSKNWTEFQTQLAECGIEFLQKGSGAVFIINGFQIKASAIDRKMTFKELIKKYGEYEKITVDVKEFKPISKEEKEQKWLDYKNAKNSFQKDKNELLQKLYENYKNDLADLKKEQKKERSTKFSKINKKSHKDFVVLKSLIAKNHLEEKLNLKDLYQLEKLSIQNKYKQFPTYRLWQIQKGLLHELSGEENINNKTQIEGIRGFDTKTSGDKVFYYKNVDSQPDVKFIDFGRRIEVRSHSERESILSAMQLAQQKWGRVKLTGSDEFINTCLKLAVENRIIISNPELQLKYIKLKDAKMNLKKDNIDKLKTDFEKYNAALGAESYRVTSQMVDKFGDKKTWVLDRENGKSLGFITDALLDKIELMNNLNSRGENIYLTPLSDKYYFILVDDLSKENLEWFLKDGFKPCAILESSPENFQAILKIPKNETENEIGNKLIRNLNQTYGDPNLAGVIHPHRAPGFYNQKEKYKINNESPSVNLVYVESTTCEKSIKLFEEIKKELLSKEKEKKIELKNENKMKLNSIDPGSAYKAHIENIAENLLKKNDQQNLDWSRLDWMAAQRMKITGFEKDQIFSAIVENGKNLREQFGNATNRSDREFEIYAVKTMTQLFSDKSRADIESIAKYKDYFLKIEGRSITKEKNIENERSL